MEGNRAYPLSTGTYRSRLDVGCRLWARVDEGALLGSLPSFPVNLKCVHFDMHQTGPRWMADRLRSARQAARGGLPERK